MIFFVDYFRIIPSYSSKVRKYSTPSSSSGFCIDSFAETDSLVNPVQHSFQRLIRAGRLQCYFYKASNIDSPSSKRCMRWFITPRLKAVMTEPCSLRHGDTSLRRDNCAVAAEKARASFVRLPNRHRSLDLDAMTSSAAATLPAMGAASNLVRAISNPREAAVTFPSGGTVFCHCQHVLHIEVVRQQEF